LSSSRHDVVIVGGGIPALTLACALQGSGLRVAVVEAQSQAQVRDRERAYALSPLSARIFRALGIWEELAPELAHFPTVVLCDADYPRRVVFTPADLGEPAVYHCAEHRVLETALQRRAAADPLTTCLYGTRVLDVSYGRRLAEVTVSGEGGEQRLTASLVVAADGQRSPVREQAGIATDGWAYWQSCITAFVAPSRPHGAVAYERFWPSGPFAILPLPGNRCQIVWIAPHREAEAIAALPPERFLAAMRQRYGEQAGELTLLSQPLVFPARLMHSRRYCQPRLALVGDAAHHCHPVGGQGLNLGIRDAAVLAGVLAAAAERGQDLGDPRVLRRYGRRRRLENWGVLLFTDILNRTFSNAWWPLQALRRGALLLMIRCAPLRRLVLCLMTGLWGTRPACLAAPRPQPGGLRQPAGRRSPIGCGTGAGR
jgi:2-octaprenyl-6-methoxyphenol hydroxylase